MSPSASMSSAHVNPNIFKYPNEHAVGSARVHGILKDYPNEQVVYVLMTQLREKEAQLAALTEERLSGSRQQQIWEESNRVLRSRVERHIQSDAEKDARIAQLEKRLADAQVATPLEEELGSVKEELAAAKDANLKLNDSVEDLEKQLKGKEWMMKSLQGDISDRRGKESHLRARIEKLNGKIKAYETTFQGEGEDVPILIAKLEDYKVRVKDLQGQVRRLTNKKLNELVVRSAPPPKLQSLETTKGRTALPMSPRGKPPRDEEEYGSGASKSSPSLVDCETFDDEDDGTFASTVSDDVLESFYSRSAHGDDDDVLGGFLSDVQAGVESLGSEGLCCAQSEEPHPDDPDFSLGNSGRSLGAAGGGRVVVPL